MSIASPSHRDWQGRHWIIHGHRPFRHGKQVTAAVAHIRAVPGSPVQGRGQNVCVSKRNTMNVAHQAGGRAAPRRPGRYKYYQPSPENSTWGTLLIKEGKGHSRPFSTNINLYKLWRTVRVVLFVFLRL